MLGGCIEEVPTKHGVILLSDNTTSVSNSERSFVQLMSLNLLLLIYVEFLLLILPEFTFCIFLLNVVFVCLLIWHC